MKITAEEAIKSLRVIRHYIDKSNCEEGLSAFDMGSIDDELNYLESLFDSPTFEELRDTAHDQDEIEIYEDAIRYLQGKEKENAIKQTK